MAFSMYMVGADGIADLPRQLDLSSPNPFKTIKIEPSLDTRSRFVDYNIVLKKRAMKEYGIYLIPESKVQRPIPLTTPAMVLDYTSWLQRNNKAGKRGADPVKEVILLRRLRSNKRAIMDWFDSAIAKTGVAAGTPKHTQMLRTTVIPKHMALNYWATAGEQAIRMDAAKLSPSLWDDLMELSSAFWESSRELAKKVAKGAVKGVSWILKLIKWLAIAFGVGIGGLIILNIVQGVRE